MQFGYVERPAHRSKAYDKDRFEVCNHRYSALCDGSHGAAVPVSYTHLTLPTIA